MGPKALGRSVSEQAFCLIPEFVLENMVPPCWRWKQREGKEVLQEMNSALNGGGTLKWKSPTATPNVELEQRKFKGVGCACVAST